MAHIRQLPHLDASRLEGALDAPPRLLPKSDNKNLVVWSHPGKCSGYAGRWAG